ncbi:MAG TPA: DNA ligase D, partial [Candidatus Saccharimonadales bacterium]|nr:DNA ligase D [Candidatus Saccharimonadales bacterium]
YGAGEVIIWDQGTYEPLNHGGEAELRAGLKKGHLTFFLFGKKLQGEFALIRLENAKEDDAWLLIKKGDEKASTQDITKQNTSVISGKTVEQLAAKPATASYPKASLPKLIKPMLCTLITEPFDEQGWLFELKWDGYRAIGTKKGGGVQLYSRNQLDFRPKYPEIVEALRSLKDDVVLDGEIVAIDQNGTAHFEWLQSWGHANQGSLHYYVFDILWHNGHDVQNMPLIERKKLLKATLGQNTVIRYSDHIETTGKDLFKTAHKHALEGIVAKKADSLYRQDVRGHDWLKIKTHLRQETVIGGFTEPRGSRSYLGSLLLGIYDKDGLNYIGHSGGGMTVTELKDLHQRLLKLERKTSPFTTTPKPNAPVHWVEPKLICEVSFSEWTSEGSMRHPKFEGLRSDKAPKNVHKEQAKTPVHNEPVRLPGSAVAFSHLNKIFWPERGYTKGDLINYYREVGPTMLTYLKDRPESLLRQPGGYQDKGFFQKDITTPLPAFTASKTVFSESTKENVHFLVCNNLDTLLYMAQLGCIEINPWSSRLKTPDKPDWAVMDLDPEGVGFKEVVSTALVVHEVCREWKIPAYPKTSGKTGIHIFIPLGAHYAYEQARQFVQLIALEVNKRIPKITSVVRSPEKRQGKVYLDYLQNSKGQTLAAPYSVRPTKDASVSMPLEWDEVTLKLKPSDFTIKNAVKRLHQRGDLWAGVLKEKTDISKVLHSLEP